MNALWLKNLSSYKYSDKAILTAEVIIKLKNQRRDFLIKHYKHTPLNFEDRQFNSLNDILLFEARTAKDFWNNFRHIVPPWCNFRSRKPHSEDTVNKLLDVGYHHLANLVSSILEKYEVPTDLGIFHAANSKKSKPLVYDLMEIFRGDVVESELIRFLKLKKKPIIVLSQKDIAHFLHRINRRIERNHFLKDLGQCRSYKYYMEIQILKFMKAVNHKTVFDPIYLPFRHDNRCLNKI